MTLKAHFHWLTLMSVLACLLMGVSLTAALAQSAGKDADEVLRGELLLRRHCSQCHAVGVSSASLHPSAPLFRDLSKRYPIESLAEALAEGIMVGHPDMPVFTFQAKEVDQIISYLESIQVSR